MGKLLIKNLVLLTKNKNGLELLAFKYTSKLLLYYKHCLNEYFCKNNIVYKSILPQISIILVRIFQNTSYDNTSSSDKDYKKFKKQTQSFLLLNLYKSSFLIKISSIFKLICKNNNEQIELYINQRILDGILNILNQIPLILKK